jgi:hypothetical protein
VEKAIRGTSLSDIAGFLYSLVLVALALVGMIGILYHALAPKGSLGAWAGRLWTSHPIFASLIIVGLVAMALTARSQQVSYQRATGRSDLPLYLFVALGTFFAARWITIGAL